MLLIFMRSGTPQYYWLTIPIFALVSLLTRPFSGKLTDNMGRVWVMCFGGLITAIACGFYLIIPFGALIVANRAFHGLCAGFTPTGFTAYADDIVHSENRGEAMGIIGICNNVGSAMGWLLGSLCTTTFNLEATFIIASCLGIFSTLIFSKLKEVALVKQKFTLDLFKLDKSDLLDTRVLLPGVIMLLNVITSGAILALISDYTLHLGYSNKGMFMGIYIAASLVVRFFSGKWSDKYGRVKISNIGTLFVLISMLLLSVSTSLIIFICAAICFGIGWGLLSPSLFAWAADKALPDKKGRAIGAWFCLLWLACRQFRYSYGVFIFMLCSYAINGFVYYVLG